MSEKNENGRLETFCDGVFAIALTLLILEIKVPPIHSIHTVNEFWHGIAEEWPSWFGFLLSFCIIFITWVNHNRILNLIDKSSPQFIYANGFKLLTIIILPFTTKVMAEYLQTDNSQPAISLYCFGVLLNNVGWNVLIWSALHPHLLAKNGVSKKQVQPGIRSAQYGFFITLFIFILSFWFPIIAIVLVSITWIAWIILGIALTRRKQEE